MFRINSGNTISIVGLLIIALWIPLVLNAEQGFLSDDDSSHLSTIPHNPEIEQSIIEADMDRIAVRHMGWNETLRSWAQIKLDEITSKKSIRGQEPIYTVLSLIYEQQKWYGAKIFPIEHPEVGKILGVPGKWVSAKDLLENENLDVFQELINGMRDRKDELDQLVEVLNAAEQARYYKTDEPGVIASFVPENFSSREFHDIVNSPEKKQALKEEYEELRAKVKKEQPFFNAGNSLLRRWTIATNLESEFLIVPDLESLDEQWIAANATKPSAGLGNNQPEILQISNSALRDRNAMIQNAAYTFDQKLLATFSQQDASLIVAATREFLDRVTEISIYPTEKYRALKNFYVGFKPMRIAYLFYGLSLIFFGLYTFFRKPASDLALGMIGNPFLLWGGIGALIVGLGFHTTGGVIRLSLTGHMPVSNMYESITFTAWCAVLIGTGLELWKRKGTFGIATAVVGFLLMVGVSLMPLHETRLHPLRAVLNSYWLNIHVTAMLVSYSAFLVATIFSICYILKAGLVKFIGRETFIAGSEPLMNMEMTESFMYRMIQIGWPILTVGICLGAIWADTAWGRYWGWDPKETWAFITWIVYTIYLHSRMVMGWRGVGSALFAFAGFIMVMITWLGVSYLPWFAGGLHTYASPN